MFVDALEVEENFRLPGRILDQGSTNENDKELDQVEVHEMKEEFTWKIAFSSSIQKEDQHGGGKVGSFIGSVL